MSTEISFEPHLASFENILSLGGHNEFLKKMTVLTELELNTQVHS